MISGWKCVATSLQEPGPVFPLRAKFQSQKVNVRGDYRTDLLLTVTDHVGICVYVDIRTYMCMYEWICKHVWEAMACGWAHGSLKRDCYDSMTCTVKPRNLRRWEGKTKRTVHKPFIRAPIQEKACVRWAIWHVRGSPSFAKSACMFPMIALPPSGCETSAHEGFQCS